MEKGIEEERGGGGEEERKRGRGELYVGVILTQFGGGASVSLPSSCGTSEYSLQLLSGM
tara:strand:+ start:447 stop:623 length:177 start_codon:yes stop_codon:yes gene_type:complete